MNAAVETKGARASNGLQPSTPPRTAKPASTAPAVVDFERKAAEQQERITDLEKTLADVDSMADGCFDRIAAIAKLALHYMKSPENIGAISVIEAALETIWCVAEEAQRYQQAEVTDAGLVSNNDKRNFAYVLAQKQASVGG